jgi:uncharacterized protein YecT (DUF1311 family)
MKVILRSVALFPVALFICVEGCSKTEKKAEVAQVAQDTMLLHDLAEANRNTAAAAAADTTEAVIRSGGGAGPGVLLSGSGSPTSSAPSMVIPNAGSQPGTVRPTTAARMSVPTRANDAPTPTNVSGSMTSSGDTQSSRSSRGNPCDSPNPTDQRTCLNRSIVANDADLNSTYRELISQSRQSGGSELEERFRQAQREWVNRRDVECRDRGAGALWARERAACLAEFSRTRTAELQRNLNSLRGQQ